MVNLTNHQFLIISNNLLNQTLLKTARMISCNLEHHRVCACVLYVVSCVLMCMCAYAYVCMYVFVCACVLPLMRVTLKLVITWERNILMPNARYNHK